MSRVLETVQPPYWSGLAADVFSERLRAVIDGTKTASNRHFQASGATQNWAAELSAAQESADEALKAAEEALEDIERAQALVDTLTAEQTALVAALAAMHKTSSTYTTVTPPPGVRVPSGSDLIVASNEAREVEFDLINAGRALEDAQERLKEARAKARTAEAEYGAAEKVFAHQLEATLDGAMEVFTEPQLNDFVAAFADLSKLDPSASTNSGLMSTLKQLSPNELAALIAEDPELLQEFWAHPPSPDEVAKWWSTVKGTPLEAQLIATVPGILGNLAGLPFGVRNDCNMVEYQDALKHRDQLPPVQRQALDQINKALARGGGPYPASLVCFNLGAVVPMVAVGFGDLDTAASVTWGAPGMAFDASQATDTWSLSMRNLLDLQHTVDPEHSHAGVAWLGYDAPDLATVNIPGPAASGSWRFANELDGTHATRAAAHAADPACAIPTVAVVAHSYGTTMAADALTHTKFDVDSFTMVGSAGIDTRVVHSLTDLHVKTVNGSPAIYTTSAKRDDLAPWGAKTSGRANPNLEVNEAAYIDGAQSFSSEGARGPNGELLLQTQGHNPLGEQGHSTPSGFLGAAPPEGQGYFDIDTEALFNIAGTTTGQLGKVVGGLTVPSLSGPTL